MKRQRGRRRSGGGGNSNNPNRHFESNGPDVKIRGSAQQVLDKYLQYARDAQTSGDRINAEAYFQHAEHYARILAAMQPKQKPQRDDESENKADGGEAKSDDKAEAKDDGDNRSSKSRDDADKGADETKADDGEKAEDKPKPRRRASYKKREEAAAEPEGEGEAEDGVMKTLSRGRKSAASDETPAAETDEEPQPAK